jgi:O-antigen/teichoic acid export membrane protein
MGVRAVKIENEDRRIASMLKSDTAVLLVFLAVFLGISTFVFTRVLNITIDDGAATVLIAAFAFAVVVMTCTIAWVIAYLHKFRKQVYEGELIGKELMKKQKEEIK